MSINASSINTHKSVISWYFLYILNSCYRVVLINFIGCVQKIYRRFYLYWNSRIFTTKIQVCYQLNWTLRHSNITLSFHCLKLFNSMYLPMITNNLEHDVKLSTKVVLLTETLSNRCLVEIEIIKVKL